MNLMPDPLHPAIVHFPVVLIVLGSVTALVAVFWRKGYVPIFAAVLLSLGALGAWAAVQSGESDGGLVESLTPKAEALLNAHEKWAERTLTLGITAAVLAIVAASLVRFPRVARATAAVAAVAACVASWAVYETGHRGGALVFKHATGVSVEASASVNGGLKSLAEAHSGSDSQIVAHETD